MWLSERNQTQKNVFSRSQSPWPSNQAKLMYFERTQNGVGPQEGRTETPRQLSDLMQSPLRGQGSRLQTHTHTVRTKLSGLLEDSQGASLLVQWLGRSPQIGARVQSLVREPDPTCCSELSTLNTYFKIKQKITHLKLSVSFYMNYSSTKN